MAEYDDELEMMELELHEIEVEQGVSADEAEKQRRNRIADMRKQYFSNLVFAGLLEEYRETGEPIGITPQELKVSLKSELSHFLRDDKPERMVWYDLAGKSHRFRVDGDETAFFFGRYGPFKKIPEEYEAVWAKYEEKYPHLKNKWVERIIEWSNPGNPTDPNGRWEEKKLREWGTTWVDRNNHYAEMGMDRKNGRFGRESDPEDKRTRVGITEFFMEEWLRLKKFLRDANATEDSEIIKKARAEVYAYCRTYSDSDWKGFVEWGGYEIVMKFFKMSREHEDKTSVARELSRYEQAAPVISGSMLYQFLDLIKMTKKLRETRLIHDPQTGFTSYEWKEVITKTVITGFVCSDKATAVRIFYLLQQIAGGVSPNVDEPVTRTPRDEAAGIPDSQTGPDWEVFGDFYLDIDATVVPEGKRPHNVPSTGSVEYFEFEDGMRRKVLWYWLDRADTETIRALDQLKRDDLLTVKIVEDTFRWDGNVRYGAHWVAMPGGAERRQALWLEEHREASIREENKMLVNGERETMKWSDANKAFDSRDGLYWRLPSLQAERRDYWLDYIDQLHFRWFTHPEGLAAYEGTDRSAAEKAFTEGFGKHHKELSVFGIRSYPLLQNLFRFADARTALGNFVESRGANARVMQPPKDPKYGTGYDPDPRCVGEILGGNYNRQRHDGHTHGDDVMMCEAKHPGETPRQHYLRVRYMRNIARILLGDCNRKFDYQTWLQDYWAHRPDKAQNPDELLELKKEMVKAGTARSKWIMSFAEWSQGQGGRIEEWARSVTEAKFAAIADVWLPGVSEAEIAVVEKSADDVWIDMMLHVTDFLLKQAERIGLDNTNRNDAIARLDYEVYQYVNSNPWSKEGLHRQFKQVTGKSPAWKGWS